MAAHVAVSMSVLELLLFPFSCNTEAAFSVTPDLPAPVYALIHRILFEHSPPVLERALQRLCKLDRAEFPAFKRSWYILQLPDVNKL